MKKFVAGVLVGIVAGYYIASTLKYSPSVTQTAELQEVNEIKAINRPSAAKDFISKKKTDTNLEKGSITLQISKEEVAKKVLNPQPQQATLPEADLTHFLNLDISEEQIGEMELHLADLQKEVSLFRDNQGWIVRFHTQNNLLSQAGLKDNDFIRFAQLENLKKDPNQANLISRLEDVMIHLQR